MDLWGLACKLKVRGTEHVLPHLDALLLGASGYYV